MILITSIHTEQNICREAVDDGESVANLELALYWQAG